MHANANCAEVFKLKKIVVNYALWSVNGSRGSARDGAGRRFDIAFRPVAYGLLNHEAGAG